MNNIKESSATIDTPLAYSKHNLNPAYLHDKNKRALVSSIDKEAGGQLI